LGYLASWQPKNLTKRLKTVFFGESLVFKGLKPRILSDPDRQPKKSSKFRNFYKRKRYFFLAQKSPKNC